MSTTPKAPKPRRPPKELTERQKAFCREYLTDYNGQRAAVAVGYAPKNARITASKYLTQPNIQKELGRLIAPIQKRAELKASAVLENLMRVAFGDVRELLEDDGSIKNLKTIGDMHEPLIAGFKVNGNGVTEVKIENRMKARELLMRNLGLLKEQLRLDVSSELTLEEDEKISAFSDEELERWNEANDIIHRLLHPDAA